MEAQLKIISGPFNGHVVPMPRGKFLIGREPDCQCVLDDLSVSRHHCVLLLDDWTLRVRDLGSKNGTLVNRNSIGSGEMILNDGDVVSIGTWVAHVTLNPTASVTNRDGERDSLDTNHFESDTTQLGDVAARPAERAEEH